MPKLSFRSLPASASHSLTSKTLHCVVIPSPHLSDSWAYAPSAQYQSRKSYFNLQLQIPHDLNHRKTASKAQYDNHTQASLMPLPWGSYVYAKPRPSHWGNLWIYGQIIDSTAPHSYNITTGHFPQPRPTVSIHSSTSRQPIHTATASRYHFRLNDPSIHHPLSRSNKTHRSVKLQQSMIIDKLPDLDR